MRLGDIASRLLPIVALVLAAVATPLATELDIQATANFPPSNPFAHVVNGERNQMALEVENKSPVNVTLKSAGGSIHDPESGKFIKNTTALTYGVTLISGAKTVLPYNFYSEHKPREVLLKIWVNYDDGSPSGLHRTMAYNSVVTIVEPPGSFFDLPLLFSYVVVLAILGGIGYLVYENYVPKTRKKARKHVNKSDISSPVGTVSATAGSQTYEEEWIPSHLLKQRKGKKESAVSSGDESAAEKKSKKTK
ncbi:hypothetical protein FRB99_000288 [Tulasnella sp. 403]|nr:hypothetical protein FRB99_000288 [Tulasnella sp. 403]